MSNERPMTANEIEITPDMMRAGIEVFVRAAPSLAPEDYWVREIFKAMIFNSARPGRVDSCTEGG
jgi:hypothetical protein